MAALIVGGDRVAPYRNLLADQGFGPVRHWSGRKPGDNRRAIPLDTSVVVVMVDQINHALAWRIRREANGMAVPVVFCKRSLPQLTGALQRARGDLSLAA